jgi:hypothetical protein
MFNLLMSLALSLSFYTIFFSLLPLTLAVLYLLLDNDETRAIPFSPNLTCLIMMQHVSFSPNLYTTALTVLHVMFPVTFKSEGLAKCPARLQVELYNGN